jgi:hypothetical protein
VLLPPHPVAARALLPLARLRAARTRRAPAARAMAPAKGGGNVEALLTNASTPSATLATKLAALDADARCALFGKKKNLTAVVSRLQQVRARVLPAARGGDGAVARARGGGAIRWDNGAARRGCLARQRAPPARRDACARGARVAGAGATRRRGRRAASRFPRVTSSRDFRLAFRHASRFAAAAPARRRRTALPA